jgi:hypothetical protein
VKHSHFVETCLRQAQLALASQRGSEDAVELRFVAVPADPDAHVVLGTEHLLDLWHVLPKASTLRRASLNQYRIGSASVRRRSVCRSRSRMRRPGAYLVLPKLERRQRRGGDISDQGLLDGG